MKKEITHSSINPYRTDELRFWARKWNITVSQVKDLVGVTGSSRVDYLQAYLQRTGLLK